MAGGVVYLVYDQQLLGPSDKSHAVLQKAEEVVPPAMYQFSQYVCEQTGLKIPQVPPLRLGGRELSMLGWTSVPGPSSPAGSPPHWGVCCPPCL